MVELVDTLGSGSSVRRDVGVRVSPSAPNKNKSGRFSIRLFLFSAVETRSEASVDLISDKRQRMAASASSRQLGPHVSP